jgi:hypothetical protein
MATWREWRAWRREFKSLGIRQVKEREARSIWHQEKQQAAPVPTCRIMHVHLNPSSPCRCALLHLLGFVAGAEMQSSQ